MLVVGDYESGGEFIFTSSPHEAMDLRSKVMLFDGKCEHMSNPHAGGTYRCSIVVFTHCCHGSSKDKDFLQQCGFVFPPLPRPPPAPKVKSKPSLSAVGGSGGAGGTPELKVKSKPSLSAVGGSGSSGSGAAANVHRDDDTSSDEETVEVTAPKVLKTFRSVLAVTAPKELKDKGFVVEVLYDGTLYTWKQDTPFTDKEVKVALWYNALQQFGDLMQVADDIVIHRWGFPIDDDQETFWEKVCLLKCTLRSDERLRGHFKKSEWDEVDDPDLKVTIRFPDVEMIIGVKLGSSIGELKDAIEDSAGVVNTAYYLRHFNGKSHRNLDDHYTFEDYGFKEDVTFEQVPKLGGTGKRAQPGAGGEGAAREEKATKIRALCQTILTNMVMSQGTRNIVSHNVRTRIMELERDFQQRKPDVLFQHLYTNMTEQQMLSLQEKYVAAGRNMSTRYLAIAKGIFEQHFDQIEECKVELDKMTKMLNDTATLAMFLQYCGDDGFLNWADFNKTLNKTVTEKSRAVGAAVGAAAAGAAAAGAAAAGARCSGEARRADTCLRVHAIGRRQHRRPPRGSGLDRRARGRRRRWHRRLCDVLVSILIAIIAPTPSRR
jgi:hypothetical protein